MLQTLQINLSTKLENFNNQFAGEKAGYQQGAK
jgi:hypothetical protein